MLATKKRWEIKEEVTAFRKQGFSYSEIMRFVPLAKSTVSNWCKDIKLTDSQIQRLQERKKQGSYAAGLKGSKANQERRAEEVRQIKEKAKSEALSLINDNFWVAGLVLYWAEGNKAYHVGVSNSDPDLIVFMLRWLRKYCEVDKLKVRAFLNLHSGQNEDEIKTYWSEILQFPKERFGKSYIKKEGTGHRKNILYKGTIRIDISNKNLLYRILGWINGVKQVFNENNFKNKLRPHSSAGRAPDS